MANYRETVEGPGRLLSELPMVGQADIRLARLPGLGAHRHPKTTFEIFFIDRGEVEWWVENEEFKLNANTVYINKPGETHGSQGISLKPCRYFWIQLAFPEKRGLPGLTQKQTQEWARAFSALQPRHFPGNAEIKSSFRRLFEECRQPRADSMVVARGILHQLLGAILRLHEAHVRGTGPRPAVSYAIRQSIDWIDSHIHEAITVENLARVADLSVSRFRERFSQEVGLSPHHYISRRKVTEAKRRLVQNSASVTRVAHELGFASSQYFATVFKRMEGISPRHYRGPRRRPGTLSV
jgi:AraC-like DNA-binding protein/mannose-6-phosphate isomerase-like protein (cupin superfamily)